ncbi:MAG TPA: FHA domain-containing protein, partial [Myxococcota bacterium]|nr:FHA domain-containing protein [Myxococcota bacterium]
SARNSRARLDHRSTVFELRPAAPRRAPQISIGRAEENDVVIQDETVSTRHALFLPGPAGGGPAIQDIESTNGTRVNDATIIPMRVVKLRDGDLVSFGDATFFYYSPAGLWTALRKLLRD